jgi:YaiO family outer membrane protein
MPDLQLHRWPPMQVLLLAAACAATCPDSAAAYQEGPQPLEVEVSHSREVLTGGRGEWTETTVRVTHRDGPQRSIYLQGRHLHRFGVNDADLTLGTHFPLAPAWTLHLDAGFSPAPVFLPEWNVGGLLSHTLGGGWVLGYGLRHLEYPGTPVLVQQGAVDYFTGPYFVGYTLTHASVRGGGDGFSHTGRAGLFYRMGSIVGVGATAGRGAETVAPEDVRLLEIGSLVAWGIHWVDRNTGISWALGWHRHGEEFQRSGLQIGVRQRL